MLVSLDSRQTLLLSPASFDAIVQANFELLALVPQPPKQLGCQVNITEGWLSLAECAF